MMGVMHSLTVWCLVCLLHGKRLMGHCNGIADDRGIDRDRQTRQRQTDTHTDILTNRQTDEIMKRAGLEANSMVTTTCLRSFIAFFSFNWEPIWSYGWWRRCNLAAAFVVHPNHNYLATELGNCRLYISINHCSRSTSFGNREAIHLSVHPSVPLNFQLDRGLRRDEAPADYSRLRCQTFGYKSSAKSLN